MRLLALAHVILAVVLSILSFVAPTLVTMTLQREVEVAVYGGAIALFFELVAVGIAVYAKARRILWAAVASTVLTAALTFTALWRMTQA